MDSSAAMLKTVVRDALKVFTPPPDLTVSQWADSTRQLPKTSASPGQWKTIDYQKEMLDTVGDQRFEGMVVMSSAQVGKSELLLNVVGYHVHHDPCAMLLVQPTLEMAETFSKDRLDTMIDDTPALKEIVSLKARTSSNTVRKKSGDGWVVALAGANSPASLASRPVRLVLLDEVDRFPASAGEEGDPVKLALKRLTTFYNSFWLMVSTPTTKGTSRIEKAFFQSDQRRFHVPCPDCGEFQVLKFSNLKWDKDPMEAYYVCDYCGVVIGHSQKESMRSKGKWIPENPGSRVAGFHLNELYSPWKTWGQVAQDFLEAKDDPEQLKVFVNTSLGETWQPKGDAPDWKKLYDTREDYKLNTIPGPVKFLTCGVDVQKDRFELEILGWAQGDQSFVIDYRVIPCNTSDPSSFAHLDSLLNESWTKSNGVQISILRLAIDSGYLAQSVYSWAANYPPSRVMVVKGREQQQTILSTPSAVELKHNGRRMNAGVKLWNVGINVAKRELYGRLRLERPTNKEIQEKGFPKGFCHFSKDLDEHYFKMLCAEQEMIKKVRGYPKFYWTKVYERNEALDCRVYNRAVYQSLGAERFSEKDFEVAARSSSLVTQASSGFRIIRKKSKFLG